MMFMNQGSQADLMTEAGSAGVITYAIEKMLQRQ